MINTPVPNLQLIASYGYWIIFPLMIFEGPIITVIAGFLSSLGYFNVFVVYLVMILADLIGDSIYYAIGSWEGGWAIKKWGHYVGISIKHVEKIKNTLKAKGFRIFFISKMAIGIGTVTLLAAGMARMPYPRFILLNVLPTLLKTLTFISIGYFFGYASVPLKACTFWIRCAVNS